MNTFPPAKYPPPMTRRLFNTWRTGFVINVSQCSEPNHEQRLSDATALECGAETPFHLRNIFHQGPEGSSTPGNQVLPLRQVNVLATYVESNHEYRLSDPTAVALHAD